MTLTHLWEIIYNRWYRGQITRCDICDEHFTSGGVLFTKGAKKVLCDNCHLDLKIKNEEQKIKRLLTEKERHERRLKHIGI